MLWIFEILSTLVLLIKKKNPDANYIHIISCKEWKSQKHLCNVKRNILNWLTQRWHLLINFGTIWHSESALWTNLDFVLISYHEQCPTSSVFYWKPLTPFMWQIAIAFRMVWIFCTIIQIHNGVFTNSPQYKNANIANFVLAVPLEMNWTIKSGILKCNPLKHSEI